MVLLFKIVDMEDKLNMFNGGQHGQITLFYTHFGCVSRFIIIIN